MQDRSIIPPPYPKTQAPPPLTDAELVISSAARLEQRLNHLLSAALIGPHKRRKYLLRGPYVHRAILARCTGLISQAEFNDLMVIIQIRNRFAHDHPFPDLRAPRIRCLLGDLIDYPALRQACRRDGRAIFSAAANLLDDALAARAQTARPFRPC